MKTIKMVTEIAAMAEYRAGYNMRIGEAKRGNYVANFTMSTFSETAELYHYGTRTVQVRNDLDGGGWYISRIYGESRSDADSVNTFLAHFDISRRYTYRPVNGGFMEVK